VLNNDNAAASPEDFAQANVALALDVFQAARDAGIRRFVNVSSFHALDPSNRSPYAESKRDAARQLSQLSNANDLAAVTVYFPAVVGENLAGKLAAVARLPRFARKPMLTLLGAARPTVNLDRVTETILNLSAPGLAVDREFIVANDQEANPAYLLAKRGMDIAFSLIILVLFSWLLLAIGLVIRLQSDGPALFRQERLGKDRRPFTCYKFRTMDVRAPNVGSHEVSSSVITPVGRILRRTKLDELPQAINILLNQMSLVGPRPCLPTQNDVIAARERLGVFSIMPGITGLAQIRGIDMSTPETLAEWDARYMATRSIVSDLQIILATARGSGKGDAADKSD